MNRITGIVRPTSPLHVATFDEGGSRSKDNTKMMTSQFVFMDGLRYRVPYFPANDIRGRLRRKAARYVLNELASRGIKVSRPLYSGLMSSAISDSIGEYNSLEEIQRARKHLYMGIFGGGLRMIRTAFRPADMVPVVKATIGAKMVPASHDEELRYFSKKEDQDVSILDGFGLTTKYMMVRKDDVADVMAVDDMMEYIEDAANAITEHQVEVSQQTSKRSEAKKRKAAGEDVDAEELKKRDMKNIYGFEAIVPGVPMFFNIDFDDLSEGQVGLLVSAIRDMLAEPIGGVIRAGMGKTDPRDLWLHYDDEKYRMFSDATDELLLHDDMTPFVSAMTVALSDIDPVDLASYFLPTKAVKAALKG